MPKEKYTTIIILPKKKSKMEEIKEEISDFFEDRDLILLIYVSLIWIIFLLLFSILETTS